MLRLLAHWASQSGGVKVNEDELLAELRSVGADEWEQAVAETERDLQETPGGKAQRGRRVSVLRRGDATTTARSEPREQVRYIAHREEGLPERRAA